MPSSKERLKDSLNHKQPDKIPVDLGSTGVTGIHVLTIERLRNFYGLGKRPVRLIEPYQMLGEIDTDLAEILHLDVVGVLAPNTLFGFPNDGWQEYKTHWGQLLLVPGKFNPVKDENGDFLIFAEDDKASSPSGKMPKTGYFFDSIIRQEPVIEERLNPEDNLEEFGLLTEKDLKYWVDQSKRIKNSEKGVMANFGGNSPWRYCTCTRTFYEISKRHS